MVSGRPLLYLSLPGVAFLLGVFWFRRRNRNRTNDDDGDGKMNASSKEPATAIHNKANDEDNIQKTLANGIVQQQPKQQQQPQQHNSKHNVAGTPARSKSMNINGTIPYDEDTTTAAAAAATTIFGKSAPISIVPNGKTSPIKHDESLHSTIDEDASDVDLPGSLEHCGMPLYSCNVNSKDNKPIVIKATRTPKISPENSFLESKYTKECEQNNNFEPVVEQAVQQQQQQTQHTAVAAAATPQRAETTDDDDCDTSSAKQTTTDIDNELDANGNNKKRNVDAASPALSMCSVQSGDSGTGSSLPRSEANRNKITYEFFFPDNLIGQLYGRKRTFINQLQAKTAASVSIRKNPCGKLRICKIEGSENEINAALAKIRQRLPIKRYPNFTMQRIHFALPQSIVPLSTESLLNLQLNLIEGINNDVVVSAVITGGHIFVQHPLHPSHPSLAVLQKCLYDSYTSAEAPFLPRVEISAVCVMPVNGIWYRVQIVEQDAEDEMRCIVKFLDFGGYMNVHFNELRQIRSDFMAVPFQATECLLSNIEPTEECWTPDAADILCKLTKGIVLQAQVAGYNSHNIPEIYLFAYLGPNNVIFINKELVARNLAKWVEVRD